jgi:hypothetical protein
MHRLLLNSPVGPLFVEYDADGVRALSFGRQGEHPPAGTRDAAARDDALGRFRTGDAVGYAGDELVAWGEPEAVLRSTIEHLAEGRELVTCIAGAEAPLGEDEVEQALPDGLELDFHEGGQPAWWYLLAVE